MPVADAMKAMARGIGMLVPGVSDELALQTATNARQRTALGNMIENAWRHETDPANFNPQDQETKQRILSLQKMQEDLQKLGPFDSPKKIHAAYGEYVSNHPMALGPVANQPQGPTAVTGPAAPGVTPGKPTMIPPVDQSAASGAPPAAAPGTSPVQPSQQTGGASGQNAPFPEPIKPVENSGAGSDQGTGSAAPTFSVNATGAGPTPPIATPKLPARQIPPMLGAMYTGTPELAQTYDARLNAATQLAHPAVQAQAAADQALVTLQSQSEFQNANAQHKIAMLKNMVGQDVWNQLPPMAQTDIVADALGMKLSGMGSLYTPHTLTTGALGKDLKTADPTIRTESGGELEDGTLYDKKIVAGKSFAVPIKPEVRTAPTATGGLETFNPLNPSAAPTQVPGAAGKTDFDTYYKKWLADHNANDTNFNYKKARAEWASAEQKPPQTMLVPIGGGPAQLVKPGTNVAPGAVSTSQFGSQFTPTQQSKRASEVAGDVLATQPEILADIEAVKSEIGPGAGRWNELWVNKAGLDDPKFAKLDQELDLYASALANAHFPRGGAVYREALRKYFGEAQSPDDLKARMLGADTFLNQYAKGTSARNTTGGGPAPITIPTAKPKTAKEFLDSLKKGK